MLYRIFCFLFIVNLLSSCATDRPLALQNARSNQANQTSLKRLHAWSIRGLMGISDQKQAGNCTINWQYTPQNSSVILLNPMGSVIASIRITPHRTTLITSQHKVYTAATPEALFYRQTGWRVPLSRFIYWLRGLPAPGQHTQQFDRYGRLIWLKQDGWRISYLMYQKLGNNILPQTLNMQKRNWHIKLIIHQWQISPYFKS